MPHVPVAQSTLLPPSTQSSAQPISPSTSTQPSSIIPVQPVVSQDRTSNASTKPTTGLMFLSLIIIIGLIGLTYYIRDTRNLILGVLAFNQLLLRRLTYVTPDYTFNIGRVLIVTVGSLALLMAGTWWIGISLKSMFNVSRFVTYGAHLTTPIIDSIICTLCIAIILSLLIFPISFLWRAYVFY
jgi:hypothetical protein